MSATIRCECEPVVESQYERSDARSVVGAIAKTLEELSGDESSNRTPLYDAIDPDVLEGFVEHQGNRATATDALVQFSIDNWNVFVRGDGLIRVCDRTRTNRIPAVISHSP